MKINHKVLSIPPYISTSWDNIISLHLEKNDIGETLVIVGLSNGTSIEVPNLEQSLIDALFSVHAKVIEHESMTPQAMKSPAQSEKKEQVFTFGFPLPISAENLDQMGSFLQHNNAQADAADLPNEVLTRVSSFVKTIGLDDSAMLPQPEPHCNCPHCQIARALQNGHQETSIETVTSNAIAQSTQLPEEVVTDKDLSFREWDVNQTADKLYQVTNPLDTKEYYNVFLGDPIGCTCGNKSCEHIRAVLNS